MGIIIKPIVTEKLTVQGEKLNRYGFIVDREANKLQIKAAVEQLYNVTVADVNTVNYHGKRKSRYTKAGIHLLMITCVSAPAVLPPLMPPMMPPISR